MPRRPASLPDRQPQAPQTPEHDPPGVGSVFLAGGLAGRGLLETHEPPSPDALCTRLLEDLNRPPARWKTPQLDAVMHALLGKDAATVTKRVNALSRGYQQHLRELVDAWLHTGQGPLGNRPASRHPNRTIDEIVVRVFTHHGAVPVAVKDGYVVLPLPEPTLMLDGDNGHQAAELLFVSLLVGPWRLKIARCVHCQKYFRLQHWERTYKAGTVCTRCLPERKGVRSQDAKRLRREAAEAALYEEAAQHHWRQIAGHAQWRHDAALREAIAAALTAKIKQDDELRVLYAGRRITPKWLAHKKNWMGIAAAAAKRAADAPDGG